MYKKITLQNGLRVIIVPQKSTRAVTVMALVGTGSKYENKEISGISHFLEHMFFKGTKKRPDKMEIAEDLDKVGGTYNAFTGFDYTGYWAKVASKNFPLAIDWVSDIYLNSILPPEELEKERGVIIEEINMTHDHPMRYIYDMWQALLYGDQPAGWDIAGTKETVSNINQSQMLDYRKKHYTASNTIVVIAGNVSVSAALAAAKKYFAKINSGVAEGKNPVFESQNAPQIKIDMRQTDQTHIALGFRSYNLFNPKRYALEMMSSILGGMMSSRLFSEIREKRGLAYYIRTEAAMDPETGSFYAMAGLDSKKIDLGLETIMNEFKKMKNEKVAAGELKKAKDNTIGKMTLALESSDALASFYAEQELMEKRILSPEKIFEKIIKVTAKDIQEVANDLFKSSALNLAVIGPYESQERFQKVLDI